MILKNPRASLTAHTRPLSERPTGGAAFRTHCSEKLVRCDFDDESWTYEDKVAQDIIFVLLVLQLPVAMHCNCRNTRTFGMKSNGLSPSSI